MKRLLLLALLLAVGGGLYLALGRGEDAAVEAPADRGEATAPEDAGPRRRAETPALRRVEEAALRGRCVDPEGRGLAASVKLRLLPPPGSARADVEEETRVVETDAAGRFSVNLDRYLALDLRATAPRRIDAERRGLLFTGEPLELGDLVLPPGLSFSLRILDGADEPVLDALVEAGPLEVRGRERRDGGTFFAGIDPEALRAARSDARGRVRLEGLPAGKLQLRIQAPGFLPWSSRDHELLPDDEELLIRLDRGRRLELAFADEDGAAVPGVEVSLDAMGYTPEDALLGDALRLRGRASEEGRLLIGPLGPRPYRLQASAAGYLAPADRIIRPEDGTLALVLRRAGSVLGVLRDARGALVAPQPGLELVALRRRGRDAGGRLLVGEAARPFVPETAEGQFAVIDLRGDRFRLSWSGDGRARGFVDVTGLEPGVRRRIEITLPDETRVRGRVLAHDGRPADDATVNARLVSPPGGGRDRAAELELLGGGLAATDPLAGTLHLRPALNHEVASRKDGTFLLEGLLPGARYAIGATSPTRGTSTPVEFLVPAEGLDGLDLRLPPVGAVQGRLVDGGGRALPGRAVFLRKDGIAGATDPLARVMLGEVVARGWTALDGSFRFEAIPPGSYAVDLGSRPGGGDGPRAAVTVLAGSCAETELTGSFDRR